MILYHGSNNIIKQPFLGGGKVYNDYGQGFYCTEKIELAKEWACTEEHTAYVNQYELDMVGMKILNLSEEKYSVLYWLTILLKHRRIRITTPIMKRGMEWLIENYSIDISDYDVIIGYRADDSYFSFARAFINNQISLKQLEYAMDLGELEIQYVIKSQKAFHSLKFTGYETVDRSVYYMKRKKRDEKARFSYMEELEKEVESSIYIRDLLKGEQHNETSLR